ncbi:hypothetical protein ACFOM8_22705 [Paracoccus angustae]|uniref:Uncharacterized protein n=1 Tax=Paracoccus angustae TaxID=1671480 RepID=A0ABV7UB52_9RHOB
MTEDLVSAAFGAATDEEALRIIDEGAEGSPEAKAFFDKAMSQLSKEHRDAIMNWDEGI